MFKTRFSLPLAIFAVCVLFSGKVWAQGTAFTYQGKLTDAGNPANGNFDLQFKLFDTETVGTGTQQGKQLVVNPVVASAGFFTIQLDFGADVFDGSPRYLEIGVRPAGNIDPYTVLAPRQPLTSSPYAIRTLSATAADVLSAACVNCVTSSQIQSVDGAQVSGAIPVASVPGGSDYYVQNTTTQQAGANFNISGDGLVGGNVGIGTTAPQSKLEVQTASDNYGITYTDGTTRLSTYINSVLGGAGGLGTPTNHSLFFFAGNDPKMIIGTSGNVGIGTYTPPQHRLGIFGGPFWTSNLWSGAVELNNASAIGWRANAGGQRFGFGQSTGGLYIFRTASDPGTITSPANYNLLFSDIGSVVINPSATPPTAGIALEVNGATLMTTGGSGGKIQFGTPSGETGMIVVGTNRADVRFDGATLKLLAGTGPGAMAPTNGIVITATTGNVGIGTTNTVNGKLVVEGGTGNGVAGFSGGSGSAGVYGASNGQGHGVFGNNSADNADGVFGQATGSHGEGVRGLVGSGTSSIGVHGIGLGTNIGVFGESSSTSSFAGYFLGNVHVEGTLSKSGGAFKIDHPLDPANKYLYHSFVESPDMMNIYNGNITTDENGEATITLPDYFQALNRDFRYQLTVMGQFAQAIVSSEMRDNRFTIKTDKPQVKVSWQVTGIRQDAYANANRIRVEEDKPEKERGYYLHPQVFGQSEEKGIEWARDPAGRGRLKEERERLVLEQRTKADSPAARP